MSSPELTDSTATELAAALGRREVSSVELTRACLERIARLNPRLNAFISVCEESALAEAAKADEELAGLPPDNLSPQNPSRPLLGIPLAHKDIFCTAGTATTCGSKMLEGFVPPYDATVVERFKAAGTVMLGKTNMDEFAMGSSNENSFFGPARNPWDTGRVPGGSSGGSTAAVAAGMCSIATGTDTGGSIRQPAAFSGVTGFKPTYGRVSRWGMIAFASSLDQAGPVCRSAEDAALMMQVMAGLDERDSTSAARGVPDYVGGLRDFKLKGLRVGLPRQHFNRGGPPTGSAAGVALASPTPPQGGSDNSGGDKGGGDSGGTTVEVEKAIQEALRELEKAGAVLTDIDLPNNHLSVPAYYVVAPAEASANLARYDGVRYGHRCAEPKDLEDMYIRSRSEGFGEEVKRRIMVGTYALSAGFYEAYYRKAQKIRRMIQGDFSAAFGKVDVLVGPTTPNTAFELGAKSDPVAMYLEDIYTIAVNLAGLPAASVPAGFVGGLPVGMHIIGPHFAEAEVLAVAHHYQTLTDWHRRTPSLDALEAA